ncbi:hypothetical protein MSAN_00477700 [Mycena sanguinolenta]|uniref:Uncharacterized protein n=1 Tax=Mycena sanguinolenta TaxID=230812 RepID=A0A8H6Z8S6_9AGAR|nr:hypothetical protein MSAN_00477700 [Mycena sanguinolenta]
MNAIKFLDHRWININLLKEYLGNASHPFHGSSTRDPIHVKVETASLTVKSEPHVVTIPRPADEIKLRTIANNFYEILSDSESDTDSDLEVIEALQAGSRSSSAVPVPSVPDSDAVLYQQPSPSTTLPGDDADEDPMRKEPTAGHDYSLVESDTLWLDDGTSMMRIGTFRPTAKITVEQMEYRDGPASIYPIHRIRTGIVIDLSDENYRLSDSHGDLYNVDCIIRNADNDSWESGGGSGSAQVTFAPGEEPILCRRVRSDCKGCHACELLDPALRQVERFELDPGPMQAVILAQQETRRREGNTAEDRIALYMKMLREAKCSAVDSNGNKCQGGPILKLKPYGPSRGKQHFVGCSGWTPQFSKDHLSRPIRDDIDENLLARALAGLRRKHCPHAHIVKGTQVQADIVNYPCDVVRYIYVPKDTSIRKALIIHNETGHNHPMPTLTKMTYGLKATYRQCIDANGVLGATVSKIDNAQSTLKVLDGKTPAAYAAPLHNKRVKRDILRAAKVEKYPDGLDVNALLPIYHAESIKLPDERYIQSYLKLGDGDIIIVTFIPYLFKLLDDPGVTSFDGDTTFKGIEGKLNEWELTIFAKMVQRAASLLRAYVNRASTDFFEALFDELQRLKLALTGKPFGFKKFVRGGNLLVANVDMDAAQVIGLCRSVMKYNDPEYSGIPNDTPPEEIAPLFIKVCWRHAKEPVHDFRSLVTEEQFQRLMDFVYIDSKESLEEFSAFVYGLGIKKISDWWRHKALSPWIIPCLVKSQSLIPPEVWDATPSTTNTNEAQHHWTNSLTGIKLTPVEAVERRAFISRITQTHSFHSRRKVDQNTADEIKLSLRTGILANANNEMSHRMARNAQRQSATVNKRGRDTKGKRGKGSQETLPASSSGRVKAVQTRSKVKPVLPMQSDVPVTPLSTAVVESTHLKPLSADAFANLGFDLNLDGPFGSMNTSNSDVSSAADLFPAADIHAALFDPAMFEFDFSVPMADPLDDFMNSFGCWDIPGDFGALPDVFPLLATSPPLETLPMLPPPPPDTPPRSPPITEQSNSVAPCAPRSRRRAEVDPANIITSTRTRAPSKRKRSAEGDVLTREQKKRKVDK